METFLESMMGVCGSFNGTVTESAADILYSYNARGMGTGMAAF